MTRIASLLLISSVVISAFRYDDPNSSFFIRPRPIVTRQPIATRQPILRRIGTTGPTTQSPSFSDESKSGQMYETKEDYWAASWPTTHFTPHFTSTIDVLPIPWIPDPPSTNFNVSAVGDLTDRIETFFQTMVEYNANVTSSTDEVTRMLSLYKTKINVSYRIMFHFSVDDEALENPTDWPIALAHSFISSESKVKKALSGLPIDIENVLVHLDFFRSMRRSSPKSSKSFAFENYLIYDIENRLAVLNEDIKDIRSNYMKHVDVYAEIIKNLKAMAHMTKPRPGPQDEFQDYEWDYAADRYF